MGTADVQHATDPIDYRRVNITKAVRSKKDASALKEHLTEIIEGTEFKGSHRCGQFLRHIVDRAIAGDFESLKERIIGVELFGRSTSFNTVEDSIVRVTARDVRRRLLQHYSKYGSASGFRLNLPLGSYVPELTRVGAKENSEGEVSRPLPEHPLLRVRTEGLGSEPEESRGLSPFALPAQAAARREGIWHWQRLPVILTAALILVLCGMFWVRNSRVHASAASTLPWSVLFRSPHETQLILSDPDIATVQQITGAEISVADYAGHDYIPRSIHLTPEEERICRFNLKGFQTSSIDTDISVKIAELEKASTDRVLAHRARTFEISDLRSDNNFIFLGSPRSDPWVNIFSDQLDFRLLFDKGLGREVIQNVHPRQKEQAWYLQSTQGQAMTQSYAIVAFVQNPGHSGHVLLLAGENGSGTLAAGELVTDLPRLTAALRQCGIEPHGPLRHFELLLRLSAVADSLNDAQVVACHTLADPPALAPSLQ